MSFFLASSYNKMKTSRRVEWFHWLQLYTLFFYVYITNHKHLLLLALCITISLSLSHQSFLLFISLATNFCRFSRILLCFKSSLFFQILNFVLKFLTKSGSLIPPLYYIRYFLSFYSYLSLDSYKRTSVFHSTRISKETD